MREFLALVFQPLFILSHCSVSHRPGSGLVSKWSKGFPQHGATCRSACTQRGLQERWVLGPLLAVGQVLSKQCCAEWAPTGPAGCSAELPLRLPAVGTSSPNRGGRGRRPVNHSSLWAARDALHRKVSCCFLSGVQVHWEVGVSQATVLSAEQEGAGAQGCQGNLVPAGRLPKAGLHC